MLKLEKPTKALAKGPGHVEDGHCTLQSYKGAQILKHWGFIQACGAEQWHSVQNRWGVFDAIQRDVVALHDRLVRSKDKQIRVLGLV